MDILAISVRRATHADASAIADLVNQAYQVEDFFVAGQRTGASEIRELTRTGTFLVLERSGGLAAAILVERRGTEAYLGMLSVRPELQGLGLGTRLVRIAEALGEAMGATVMTLKIVNLRKELALWYRSLGYAEVGTAPYGHRPVKQPCHFVKMHKRLGVEAESRAHGRGHLGRALGAA